MRVKTRELSEIVALATSNMIGAESHSIDDYNKEQTKETEYEIKLGRDVRNDIMNIFYWEVYQNYLADKNIESKIDFEKIVENIPDSDHCRVKHYLEVEELLKDYQKKLICAGLADEKILKLTATCLDGVRVLRQNRTNIAVEKAYKSLKVGKK